MAMKTITIGDTGKIGVIKDLSRHETPPNAWSDALNMRFIDGTAQQAAGYRELYPGTAVVPYHILPLSVGNIRMWIYASDKKIYTVINGPTHTNITRQTAAVDVDYNAQRNSWTSCLLGGIPILNDGVDPPQQWLLTGKATVLSAWPASTTASVVRAYKNSLVALNVTKSGVNYPYMVKWSHPADPGSVPPTWDPSDATKDAGESDLSEGFDKIIDGLALRDSFMIYKEASIWRMDYTGGVFVYRFQKVMGASGALSRNCIAELDGRHFVLTTNDCILHDGQSATSILDKQTRRFLFEQIDQDNSSRCFVFVDKLYNEVFVCYPSLGSSFCNKALVWNTVDKTVSFRDIPNLNHAASGPVDDSSNSIWSADSAPWDSDTTLWDATGSSLSLSLTVMASNVQKLYLLDSGTSFDGVQPSAYLERAGLSLGAPGQMKLIGKIRPRIFGKAGETVNVSLGYSDDAYAAPVYNAPVAFTLGEDVDVNDFVSGRYIAVKFANGTSTSWRLDSYDIELRLAGKF